MKKDNWFLKLLSKILVYPTKDRPEYGGRWRFWITLKTKFGPQKEE